LDLTRLWAVPLQREVSAPVVVVAEVAAQDMSQVVLAEPMAWSRHSRLTLPIRRSTCGSANRRRFARGSGGR
jgi:hypothetical protein